jgi:hypothetical protein
MKSLMGICAVVIPLASIPCWRTRHAGFSPPLSTRRLGGMMPPPSSALVRRGIPAALGRSRSGQGGHVWIFFAEPVPASVARRLGAHLVTETMERNPDIGFSSYDRFFPSQDNMPAGGFGNLIALPLQHGPRLAGNSLFLDDTNLEPHTDQRAFLSTVRRMTLAEVTAIAEEAGRPGQVTGLRLPLAEMSELVAFGGDKDRRGRHRRGYADEGRRCRNGG